MVVDARYCPKCGRSMSFIPARNGYFCNFCRLAVDSQGKVDAGPGNAVPSFDGDVPAEYRTYVPAEPPAEVTLFAPTCDLKPIVKRSSLAKGQVEALAEVEMRGANVSGDYTILSKIGRSAIVAFKKLFGTEQITPVALEMPGAPWRIRISSGAVTVELGLFKARAQRPFMPMQMPQPQVTAEFYIATMLLKGPGRELSRFVATLLGLLDHPPWASEHWNSCAQTLNVPTSKLMLDWKQYIDYAVARTAVAEVYAAKESLESARGSGLSAPGAAAALEKARNELSDGDWDAAKSTAREVGRQLELFMGERRKVTEFQDRVSIVVAEIRRIDAESREASIFDKQVGAVVSDSSLTTDQARQKCGQVMLKAATHLFQLHVVKSNSLLSGISGVNPQLSREIRESLERGLEQGRRLLESGNVQAGAETLRNATSQAEEKARQHFASNARASVNELKALFDSVKTGSLLPPEQKTKIDNGIGLAESNLSTGMAMEAGKLARDLIIEIRNRMDASVPEIRLQVVGPALNAGSWNKVVMKVTNSGTADARNVQVSFDGPVELMAVDRGYSLRAGEIHNDEMAVKTQSYGTVPVTLRVECERATDGKPYKYEAEVWLEFKQGLDLSGAKTIMIDRSVHIVDSVLSRSNVGGDGELDGVPAAAAGTSASGTNIQDSVMSRSNVGGPGVGERLAAATETKCPTCGKMISTEWKRCPYCS